MGAILALPGLIGALIVVMGISSIVNVALGIVLAVQLSRLCRRIDSRLPQQITAAPTAQPQQYLTSFPQRPPYGS